MLDADTGAGDNGADPDEGEVDDDLDLGDPDDDPDEAGEGTDEPDGDAGGAEGDAPAGAEADAGDPSAEQAAATAAALAAVQDAWADGAKRQFPLADFAGLGITGVTPEAKVAFYAQAEKSHLARVDEFKALGLVYDPAQAGSAADDLRDAALAEAWGVPAAGAAGPTVDQEVMKAVETEVAAGNVDGTIRQLLGGGKMAKFFFEGKKS